MAEFVELTIDQGATFNTVINVNDGTGSPQNLVGYSARSQMRRSHYTSSYKEFQVSVSTPALGEITMSMSAANTANLTAGRYVYDVEIDDGAGEVTRIFEGIITVLPNATR